MYTGKLKTHVHSKLIIQSVSRTIGLILLKVVNIYKDKFLDGSDIFQFRYLNSLFNTMLKGYTIFILPCSPSAKLITG